MLIVKAALASGEEAWAGAFALAQAPLLATLVLVEPTVTAKEKVTCTFKK